MNRRTKIIIVGSGLVYSLDLITGLFLVNNLSVESYGGFQLFLMVILLYSSAIMGGYDKTCELAGGQNKGGSFLDVVKKKLKNALIAWALLIIVFLLLTPSLEENIFGPIDTKLVFFLMPLYSFAGPWKGWLLGKDSLRNYYLLQALEKLIIIASIWLYAKSIISISHLMLSWTLPHIFFITFLITKTNREKSEEIILRGKKLSISTALSSVLFVDKFIYSRIGGTALVAHFSVLIYGARKSKVLFDVLKKYYIPKLVSKESDSLSTVRKLLKTKTLIYMTLFYLLTSIIYWFVFPYIFPHEYLIFRNLSVGLYALGIFSYWSTLKSETVQYKGKTNNYNLLTLIVFLGKLVLTPLCYIFFGYIGILVGIFITEVVKLIVSDHFSKQLKL